MSGCQRVAKQNVKSLVSFLQMSVRTELLLNLSSFLQRENNIPTYLDVKPQMHTVGMEYSGYFPAVVYEYL